MPSLSANAKYTNITGQVYRRGMSILPPSYKQNFVERTTQNYQMMRQISRAQKEQVLLRNNNNRPDFNFYFL